MKSRERRELPSGHGAGCEIVSHQELHKSSPSSSSSCPQPQPPPGSRETGVRPEPWRRLTTVLRLRSTSLFGSLLSCQ